MTKKVIDVYALINNLQDIKGNLNFCNDVGRYWLDVAIETINELATPVTEPQESIFDAEGWCKDFEISQEYNKILVVTYKNDIIIASPQSKNSTWQKWQPLPSV